jgi:hypothetical protein
MCSHTLTNGENVSYSAAAEKRILAIKIGAFTGVNE